MKKSVVLLLTFMLMNTLLSFVHVPCSDRKVTERRLYSCWTKYYISVGLTLSS